MTKMRSIHPPQNPSRGSRDSLFFGLPPTNGNLTAFVDIKVADKKQIKKMKLPMDVVCTVIKSAEVINSGRSDLFLIAKRAKNKIHAGKWEFPGGKVEHKENHSDAMKREVMEELGAEIEIKGLQDPIEHSYDCVKIRLFPYECRV